MFDPMMIGTGGDPRICTLCVLCCLVNPVAGLSGLFWLQ